MKIYIFVFKSERFRTKITTEQIEYGIQETENRDFGSGLSVFYRKYPQIYPCVGTSCSIFRGLEVCGYLFGPRQTSK